MIIYIVRRQILESVSAMTEAVKAYSNRSRAEDHCDRSNQLACYHYYIEECEYENKSD